MRFHILQVEIELIINNKFQNLKTQRTPEQQDKKLREVGDLYEKQFLREMLKAMRGTVKESGFIKSNQAEKIFREQLDHEYVEKWGEKGGIGMSDLIYNQLIDKYGAQLGIRPPVEKPKGPLPLDEKSNFNSPPIVSTKSSDKLSFQFLKNFDQPTMGITTVKMPWQGKLMSSTKLGADEHLLKIIHDNGLKSQLVFRGQVYPGLVGEQLQASDSIGLLSPEARAFFWNVEPISKAVSE